MKESYLYWSVYKNLEHEVIEISKHIHFSSDQKNVYSMRIADIIVRCAIEIEAISKKLYDVLGGNINPKDKEGNPRQLYFDTDCLQFLEDKYLLSKKGIILSAPSFDFKEADRIITPLQNAYKRGRSKWKNAYQSLKHDRYKNFKRANIDNMINALGALYILNLYFRDEIYPLREEFMSFDARVDSEIFSVFTYDATDIVITEDEMNDYCIVNKTKEDLEKAIYIIKLTNKFFCGIHESFRKDKAETNKIIAASPKAKEYLSNYSETEPHSFSRLICKMAANEELCDFITNGIVLLKNTTHYLNSQDNEAVINKNTNIYPTIE